MLAWVGTGGHRDAVLRKPSVPVALPRVQRCVLCVLHAFCAVPLKLKRLLRSLTFSRCCLHPSKHAHMNVGVHTSHTCTHKPACSLTGWYPTPGV